ncbi:MAG TPA: cytochrome c, partial [Opitutus sp.]|nr:cytochrome c [Opitutus sp.]
MKTRLPFCCLLTALCAGSVTSAMGGAAGSIDVRTGDYSLDPTTLDQGKVLFASHCASCHTLTQDGIGPPLGGITTLLSENQLEAWIREPSKVIASGDDRATALLRRYKAPMPPFAHLRREEVGAILAYIHHESAVQKLQPLLIDAASSPTPTPRWSEAIQKTNLVIELEDVVQLPRLPGRTPYKGITLLRADPREPGALLIDELMGVLYRVKDRDVRAFLDVREFFPEFICDPGVASGLGSFALHPEFARNGILYTIHSETFRGSPAVNASDIPADVPKWETPPLEWVLTEWNFADPTALSFAGTHREVLRFVTPTTGHAAQEIAFAPVTHSNDPDHAQLYIAIGDGGSGNLGRPDMAGHPR